VFKRIKELIVKLISVKGVFAITNTGIFIVVQNEFTTYSFLFSWLLFILGREVFKIISLLKNRG